MSDRDYCYPPDYTVLRNRLNIRAAPTLEAAECQLVAQRVLERVPAGDFDLARLRCVGQRRPSSGLTRPDLAEIDLIVALGGPMLANDDHPALRREMDYLRAAATGTPPTPVLGICLGAQLLSRALAEV